MDVKRAQYKQTFNGKIGKIDLISKSELEPKITEQLIKSVDQFLPKVKEIGDDTAIFSLVVSGHTFFVDCEKQLVPKIAEAKTFIGKLFNKIKSKVQTPEIVEKGTFASADTIKNADVIEKLAQSVLGNCLSEPATIKFNQKESEKALLKKAKSI